MNGMNLNQQKVNFMKITNNHNRIMKLTFTDKDVIHLLPKEVFIIPEGFILTRTELIT